MDEVRPNAAPNASPGSGEAQSRKKLYRSQADRRIAGVCGGVAAYLGVDSLLVRILWIVSCFVGLAGVFVYVAAWIIIPENPVPEAVPASRPSANPNLIWGIVLVLLGAFFLADRQGLDFLVPWHWSNYIPHWFNWGVLFSLVIIFAGIALLMRQSKSGGPSLFTGFVASRPEPAGATSPPSSISTTDVPTRRLTRALDGRMIGGVCGGIAKYFNIDPSLVRIGWVLMTISGAVFLGVVAYIVVMIVVPEESPVEPTTSESTPPHTQSV